MEEIRKSTTDRLRTQLRWTGLDRLIAALLFIATAGFVFWQCAHVAVIWDITYILENSTRISLGQRPYRDFPFPYAPFTFALQGLLIKLFGRVYFHQIIYEAVTSAVATVLTWRIMLRLLAGTVLPARLIAGLLAAPLIFLCLNGIFPHPFYDCDTTLLVLVCLWLLLRLDEADYPPLPAFALGILTAMPLITKQNVGLAFFVAVVPTMAFLAWRGRKGAIWTMVGAIAGFALLMLLLQLTVGLANCLHWTIAFAASRRLRHFSTMVGVYIRWPFLDAYFVCIAAVVLLRRRAPGISMRMISILLGLPFVWTIAGLVIRHGDRDRVTGLIVLWPFLMMVSLVLGLIELKRASSAVEMLPFLLAAVINGALMSSQVIGSNYAIWPWLMVLLAYTFVALARYAPLTSDGIEGARIWLTRTSALACVAMLAAGSFYSISHIFLRYVHMDGQVAHSQQPALRGLSAAGPWLPDFDELVAYSEANIPKEDGILAIPGEDPFYFTTGRVPHLPITMFDSTVDPYSAQEIYTMAQEKDIRWLIVKKNLQGMHDPTPDRDETLALLHRDYVLVKSLNNYEVLKRK
jgi:hypothetical protein